MSDIVQEAVAELKHFVDLHNIESLFIVGDYCRETALNSSLPIHHLDVVSAFQEQSSQLGSLFASEVLYTAPLNDESGITVINFTINTGTIKITFQGHTPQPYMYNQEIKDWLHSKNIAGVPLMTNVYGRDFTINSLVYSIRKDQFFDITKRAMQDLDDKTIKSLLPAEMLVKYNPISILRAIRLAVVYDFHIDPVLRSCIRGQTELLNRHFSEDRIIKKIVGILKIDGPKSLEILKQLELDKLLLSPSIKKYIVDSHEET